MEEQSQAISFANSYFSLVDGLAPGLEDHLAHNVVLDWFGRTIRGRENVAAFMKTHKVASRHVFNCIESASSISYRKSQIARKLHRDNTADNYAITSKCRLNFEGLSISDGEPVVLDPENNNVVKKVEESDGPWELNENDLTRLFALDVAPTRPEEIEASIRRMRNEERPSSRRIKADEWGFDVLESRSGVKYVEARGQIEFSKKSAKRGTELQKWRRQSQLQIAYSLVSSEILDEEEPWDVGDPMHQEAVHPMETDGQDRTLLPTLDEITEISSKLVPNINCNFGGYFPTVNEEDDFVAQRDRFLENFNAEISARRAEAALRTPQYNREGRLVFADLYDRPLGEAQLPHRCGSRFVFNYLIHLIIYQGSSRCRRSLTQEFNAPCGFVDTGSEFV
ncbi:uncharacterized protein LOC124409831 [Diprion similis]|uniref:uncharacterized protein LOC124409831 n=1 Tax=Diprion similis TaxID=362088 RepID=UPI001EF8EC4B|nr:uncharacterized protein LOC124409831 [Diprion similis]XP_046743676.1 uncharacterized protein LOC124409831 [Diprion similis]XP_046743677.1 uncharacterized protein LOC124409831 [Diprion similis]XP_046743678.1 uncharacterized protein LOC124409831 [Diprion similis]